MNFMRKHCSICKEGKPVKGGTNKKVGNKQVFICKECKPKQNKESVK